MCSWPLRWFEKEPSVLTSFQMYSGKTVADLQTMPHVRVHGSHLFLTLTGVIFNLKNDAVIGELLADLKRDHERVAAYYSERGLRGAIFLKVYMNQDLCAALHGMPAGIMLVLLLACRSFRRSRSPT